MISIPVFAIAYMLKGGWLDKVQHVRQLKESSWMVDKLLGGKLLAGLVVFIFALLSSFNPPYAFLILAAWLLAASPSMGEEAGAIGRWGFWWGQYKDAGFDRMYGVLKGVQRGAWMGAMFVFCAGATTLSIPIMGIGFVAAHFIGQEAYWRIHKKDSWAYAEPLIGLLLGLCYILGE